jgi:hypothetical protein
MKNHRETLTKTMSRLKGSGVSWVYRNRKTLIAPYAIGKSKKFLDIFETLISSSFNAQDETALSEKLAISDLHLNKK